jgi:hypothetical protein
MTDVGALAALGFISTARLDFMAEVTPKLQVMKALGAVSAGSERKI